MKAIALALLLFSMPALAQDNEEEFVSLDLNGDGRVSLAEAAGFAGVVVRFDKADRNRDGKLTQKEFDRLKKLKIPVHARPRERNAAVGASARR